MSEKDQLLDAVLEALESEVNNSSPDSILTFVQKFGLAHGKDQIRLSTLYHVYKRSTSSPVVETHFNKEITRYLRAKQHTNGKYVSISLSKFKLKTKKKAYLRVVKYTKHRKHFESFTKFYGLVDGKTKISLNVLYYLYDKWTYKNKTSSPFSKKVLCAFLTIFFTQYKKSDKHFLLGDSIYKHVTKEHISQIDKGIHEENKKEENQQT